MRRILLLISTRTYRAPAFLDAARALGIDVIVGTDEPQALAEQVVDRLVALDFHDRDAATKEIVALAKRRPLHAILAVDDQALVLAATASRALGIPHNAVDAVATTVNKHRMREDLAAAGLPVPGFQLLSLAQDPRQAAKQVRYPCVLKPLVLAGSRGVIRADDAGEFVAAFERIAAILREPEVAERGEDARQILVEDFVAGAEVAVEGMLSAGELSVLALFDKPDPLDGPYFEETLYVTPSRHPLAQQEAIHRCARDAVRALGLRDGPFHLEVRLTDEGPVLLEVAPRSIGGLCSRALRFTSGETLEEIILRQSLGLRMAVAPEREAAAAGVMMLPIPGAGTLREIRGKEAAEAVSGVDEVVVTIPVGREVIPLPEGSRYLGFVFARGETPDEVERALREAHGCLDFVIETKEG